MLDERGSELLLALVPLFTAVVLGITWMAIVFAAITWRHSDGELAAELATT